MAKFALITHLLAKDSQLNSFFYPPLKFVKIIFPVNIINRILKYLPPVRMSYVEEICSLANKKTSGLIITVPFFPTHFVTLKEDFLIQKILSGCKLAKKTGVDIVGLAAFTSIVGDEGATVAKQIDIAITSGNTYTAYLAIDGILKAVDKLEMDKSEVRLTIIGATGDIGSICAKVLSKLFKSTILIGRDKSKLENLAKTIGIKNISVNTDVKYCVQNSDLVLCVASSIFSLFDVKDLKPGSVLCDVSVPPSVLKTKANFREDVLIFDGGKSNISSLGIKRNKEWKALFPDDVIYGCLAETILLALEEKIENFSLGRGNITEEKIEIISKVAKKHGFETAVFKYGDYHYSESDLEKIKKSQS
jgi:predicted amino acid dehydrogenase